MRNISLELGSISYHLNDLSKCQLTKQKTLIYKSNKNEKYIQKLIKKPKHFPGSIFSQLNFLSTYSIEFLQK